MTLRARIGRILFSKEYEDLEKQKIRIEERVNQRVADFLLKMDPLEPLMRKYHVAFSGDNGRPEDRLAEADRLGLFMWGYATAKDPHFTRVMDWLRDTQGNNTLRKGKQSDEWLYGRASIATITLLVEEVGRLASKYEEYVSRRDVEFDNKLVVEA